MESEPQPVSMSGGEKGLLRQMDTRVLYDMEHRNYDWESFKYEVPRKYMGEDVKKMPLVGAKAPRKTNYLDELHRVKKHIPGPNKYHIKEQSRPLSGKLDRTPRQTLSQTIIAQSKKENIPGPGQYHRHPRPQTAKTTPAKDKEKEMQRDHYLH